MAIPVCIPAIPKNALRYVSQVIQKNWVSSLCLDESVNYLGRLEKEFSAFVGAGYGIAVTSGTTALDLAVATLGIGPGDEVIVPSFTMIASASCVIHNGARPVFVDADPHTWCMDADLVEAAITEHTKGVIPVHIYGYPADMERIMTIADKYGLWVIEDAAEAIGTVHKGRMAGSIGHIGCFSFYANKTMTCGEGGMLVTSDKNSAQKAAMLKDQAFGNPRFIHEEIGFNFRMNNLIAAYAYASFEELSQYIEKKLNIARQYNLFLSDIPGIILPPAGGEGITNTYWMYGILIDHQKYRRSKLELRELLKRDYGIDTRDFFYPMHKQPVMLKKGYVTENCRKPVSERLWENGLYLPSGTTLTEDQLKFICNALNELKK
jgi:perosamine synthetase